MTLRRKRLRSQREELSNDEDNFSSDRSSSDDDEREKYAVRVNHVDDKLSPVKQPAESKCNYRSSPGKPNKFKINEIIPESAVIPQTEFSIWIVLLSIAAVIVAAASLFSMKSQPIAETVVPLTDQDVYVKLTKELQMVQKHFPVQAKILWVNLLSAIQSITVDDPSQPAVLLLISPKSDQTTRCLALQLATTVNRFFNTSYNSLVPVEKVVGQSPREEDVKEELDRRIKSILQHSHSVVLPELEVIPPRAALILHGYCDNFHAPFKKRVFILTATLKGVLDNEKTTQKQVDRLLHQLWDRQLGQDNSASLVSRVANNVLFVRPEESAANCAFN